MNLSNPVLFSCGLQVDRVLELALEDDFKLAHLALDLLHLLVGLVKLRVKGFLRLPKPLLGLLFGQLHKGLTQSIPKAHTHIQLCRFNFKNRLSGAKRQD